MPESAQSCSKTISQVMQCVPVFQETLATKSKLDAGSPEHSHIPGVPTVT